MKKFLVFLFSLFCISLPLISLVACSNSTNLALYVSELRKDVFEGENQNHHLSAGYGFRENPFVNDGKVGKTENLLTFKLKNEQTSDITYTISLTFNGEQYASKFVFSPVSHSLIASVKIDNFNLKTFKVTLSYGSNAVDIEMNSTLPNGTVDYCTALGVLQKEQPQMISSFCDSEGNFKAEIYARVIVKNGKAYWYIGLAKGMDKLKALLIDGATCEVLAIREIF